MDKELTIIAEPEELIAPTLTFWGRFLPPLCYFGGAFRPHFYFYFSPALVNIFWTQNYKNYSVTA